MLGVCIALQKHMRTFGKHVCVASNWQTTFVYICLQLADNICVDVDNICVHFVNDVFMIDGSMGRTDMSLKHYRIKMFFGEEFLVLVLCFCVCVFGFVFVFVFLVLVLCLCFWFRLYSFRGFLF